ncbi:uncharacterized protein [Leptinotarsa decemlineata]|uniref:uncharacterized protein n=1 Tax=Leptinotarsa decemlineata TaxID=7539 RepID=UPI003D303EAE
MSIPKIEKLDELLGQYIDSKKKILDTKISRLTAPGENYGSEMLRVDLVLKDGETDKEEDLSVVAKLIPISDFFRTMFHVQVTFKNEKEFYNTVVPTLQAFQRKQGATKVIECFPKFYGARSNLENNNGLVDDNAVLILENLKSKGYINVDRFRGFDLNTTKMLLRDIAQFHAVPLALKLNDPETFEKNVKAYLACFHPLPPVPPSDEGGAHLISHLENSENVRHLLPKLLASMKYFGKLATTFREPFATITHRDLWVNNIMIRFDGKKAVDSKIVDFQMYSYDSPATDLFFFLCTSVETSTLKAHFDDLIIYYHKIFVEILESLNIDTAPFSYDLFLDEIAASVGRELAHSIFMLTFIVHGKKGGPAAADDPSKPPKMEEVTIMPETTEKICWILEECERRNWLNF